MNTRKVLLRQSADGGYDEVAVVLEVRGKVLLLQREGSEVQVHERARNERTPDQWSYHHLSLVAPERLRDALEREPLPVVRQLILESKDGLSAADVRKRLAREHGPKLADSVWSRTEQMLHEDPEIEVPQSKAGPLKLRTPTNLPFRALFPAVQNQHRDTAGTPAGALSTRAGVEAETVEATTTSAASESSRPSPSSEARPDQSGAQKNSSKPQVEETQAEQTQVVVEPPTPPSRTTLARRVVETWTEISRDEAASLRSRPLALGLRVGKLSAKDLASFLDGLHAEDLATVALATGPDRKGLLADALAAAGREDHRRVLDQAIEEIRQTPGDGQRAQLLRLARRAADQDAVDAARLSRLARAFSADPGSEGLAWALDVLTARLVASGRGPVEQGWDVVALSTAVRIAPLDRDGPRARLVAAIRAVDDAEASHERWWRGASLDGLAAAARGRLAPLLESATVAEAVVAPAVREHLAASPSRATVATVFAWPSALARHVSGQDLARVLGALARTDSLVEGWLRVVSDAEHVQALEDELATSRSEAEELRRTETSVRNDFERVRSDLARAAEQLAAARSKGHQDNAAHDRQARIDGVRALALLAAQVLQSPAATGDQALVRQVEHACAREGLETLHRAGERVALDPSSHESLTPRLAIGASADVVRGGYTWDDGGTRTVVLKAQVMSTRE